MLKFVAQDRNGLPQKRKHVGIACETCRKRKKRCRHHQSEDESVLSTALIQHLSAQSTNSDQVREDIPIEDSSPSDLELSSRHARWEQAHPQPSSQQVNVTNLSVSSNSATNKTTQPSRQQGSQYYQNPSISQSLAHGSPSSITNTVTPRSYEGGDESRFVGDLNPEAAFLAAANSPTSPQNEVGVWSNRHVGEPSAVGTTDSQQADYESSLLFLPDTTISRLLFSYLQNQCSQLVPRPSCFDKLSAIYFTEIDPIFPILDKTNSWKYPDQMPAKILLKQAVCLAASTSQHAREHLSLGSSNRLSYREFSGQLFRAINTSITLGFVKEKVINIQVMALVSLFSQFSDERGSSADWHSRAVSLGHNIGIHLKPHDERNDQGYLTTLFCCLWALDRLNAACHGRPTLMHDRDFGHDLDTTFAKQDGGFHLLLRVIMLLDRVITLYRPADRTVSWDKFPAFEELVLDTGAVRVTSQLLATIESLYHAVAMLSCRNSEIDTNPSGAAYGRHNLSAMKLTAIVGQEFHGQLSLFPWVPYALSLSLRAAYRDLRQSKAPMFRTRARRQLLTNSDLLREISIVFPSAKNMVELAEQVIREMDRVYLTMNNTQQHDETGAQSAPDNSLSASEPEQQRRNDVANAIDGPTSGSHRSTNIDTGELLFDYDPNTFDPSIFEKLPDLDVFEHFNPDFDLEAFDATLGDTMDLLQPFDLSYSMH